MNTASALLTQRPPGRCCWRFRRVRRLACCPRLAVRRSAGPGLPFVPGRPGRRAGAAVTVAQSRQEEHVGARRVVGAALLFVAGFTVVFVLAMATVFGITDQFSGAGGWPLQIVGA